jgi:formamidopyrimidine-DNA glycosylase
VPELPEVEVVRRGLAEHVIGRRVSAVEVRHPRAVRRHLAGAADVIGRLTGRTVVEARRRGKYLWLDLGGDPEPGPGADPGLGRGAEGDALLAHLGMSGQMLVSEPSAPTQKHLRVVVAFDDGGPELRFVDQRTFGGISVEPLVHPAYGGAPVPAPIAHIARDPMDPDFDPDAVVAGLRARRTELKRALLDQSLVSGIGNIYADEALWRARLHGRRATATLTRRAGRDVLDRAAEVMAEALDQGGTSFDALYVNVNGNSGYFDRSLNVYGQRDRPCRRCGTAISREAFMNRSSYFCPRCQPQPRRS